MTNENETKRKMKFALVDLGAKSVLEPTNHWFGRVTDGKERYCNSLFNLSE